MTPKTQHDYSVASRGDLPRERFRCVPGMLNSSEVKVFHPT
jgi:hypothetical protein